MVTRPEPTLRDVAAGLRQVACDFERLLGRDLDAQVLDVLSIGPAGTKALARLLRRQHGSVRAVCRLLEAAGRIEREPHPRGQGNWKLTPA
jgi:hypothetical protein